MISPRSSFAVTTTFLPSCRSFSDKGRTVGGCINTRRPSNLGREQPRVHQNLDQLCINSLRTTTRTHSLSRLGTPAMTGGSCPSGKTSRKSRAQIQEVAAFPSMDVCVASGPENQNGCQIVEERRPISLRLKTSGCTPRDLVAALSDHVSDASLYPSFVWLFAANPVVNTQRIYIFHASCLHSAIVSHRMNSLTLGRSRVVDWNLA